MNTNQLSNMLTAAMESPDHAMVMNSYERMYSTLFRCNDKPVRAGDMDSSDIPRKYSFYDREVPSRYDLDMDTQDEYEIFMRYNFKPSIKITQDTLMIEVCNYKGEGIGFAIYDEVKNNPIYLSKDDSFRAF